MQSSDEGLKIREADMMDELYSPSNESETGLPPKVEVDSHNVAIKSEIDARQETKLQPTIQGAVGEDLELHLNDLEDKNEEVTRPCSETLTTGTKQASC